MKVFLRNFKYEILLCLREKSTIFWLILFPIILGTFFKMAFDGIYDSMAFEAIPVAVVETREDQTFHDVLTQISNSESPLLEVKFTDKDTAMKMLEDKEVSGIIISEDELSLTVSTHESFNSTSSYEQNVIKLFLEQYSAKQTVIEDVAKNNPQKLQEVITALTESTSEKVNEPVPLTEGNTDDTLPYFFNLIAMVGFLGSTTGIHIATSNQGNLSALGARKCCSPTNKLVSISAGLLGSFAVQALCTIISVSYIAFVLKIDFGSRLPLAYLSAVIGGILGVSFGFFIGSIGRMSENAKMAISTSVSMICCFFSGLMVSNMKAVIEQKVPWFNEINPAALISDTFYCLNIYNNYDRFIQKIVTMLIMITIFTIGGFLLTRRRKYASL